MTFIQFSEAFRNDKMFRPPAVEVGLQVLYSPFHQVRHLTPHLTLHLANAFIGTVIRFCGILKGSF